MSVTVRDGKDKLKDGWHKRSRLAVRSLIMLEDAAVTAANLDTVKADFARIAGDMQAEAPPEEATYNVETGDATHWEASLANSKVGLVQHRPVIGSIFGKVKSFFTGKKKYPSPGKQQPMMMPAPPPQQQWIQPQPPMMMMPPQQPPMMMMPPQQQQWMQPQQPWPQQQQQSFIATHIETCAPDNTYAIEIVSALPASVEQAYVAAIEKSCSTYGQVAAHPLTKTMEQLLARTNGRLVHELAQRMQWRLAAEVDTASFYHNKEEFAAPLLAAADLVQVNNGIRSTAEGEVQLFENAVALTQAGGLPFVSVDLGPQIGLAIFEVNAAACGHAVAAGLDVNAKQPPSVKAAAIANIGAYAGAVSHPMFRQGHFEAVSDAFVAKVQRQCGSSANVRSALVFSPVSVFVGAGFV